MAKYCMVKFYVKTNENVEDIYLVGNTKNMGFWDVKKSTKMKRLEDGTFKATKRFLIEENVEYKVVANKNWENVERGMFKEEFENHSFQAIKGHYEDIFVHYFN